MRLRRLIALTTVAAAGLAACGGGDDNRTTADSTHDGAGGPGRSLRRIEVAKETTSESPSLDVNMTFEIDADGQHVSMTMEGLGDAATGAGRFEMSVDAPGVSVDGLKLVSDGELVWASSDGQQWYEMSVDELDEGGSANTDPTAFLELLDEVGDVTEAGTEQIDGAATTRYHAVVSVEKFAEMQGLDVAALEDVDIDSMPIDVWIDGDNLIRQVQLHLEMSADGMTATFDMDVDLTPSSEPVQIDGPPAGEIIVGSAEDLGQLIAGS
jgi:hypothetical protein